MKNRQTIVIDERGYQIAMFPEDLNQVEVGQSEFYIGQTNHQVLRVWVEETTNERFILVRPL
jgi:hypothetical protein